jgi:hypothetical protein
MGIGKTDEPKGAANTGGATTTNAGSAGKNAGATPQASGSRDQVASARAGQQQTVPAKAAAQYDNLADDGVNKGRGKAALSSEESERLNDLGIHGVSRAAIIDAGEIGGHSSSRVGRDLRLRRSRPRCSAGTSSRNFVPPFP